MYYVALSSLNESCIRIENRVRKGGHDIPKEDVTKRFAKRFDDAIKVLPYCDEVHFMTMKTDLSTQANIKTVKL